MKKAIIRILILLLILAAAVCAWFYGYHNHKNLDNVPSKELMVTYLKEKGELYTTGKVEGYSRTALSTIWGEPDGELFGMYGLIWESGEDFFVVYFDSESLATGVKLGQKDGTA